MCWGGVFQPSPSGFMNGILKFYCINAHAALVHLFFFNTHLKSMGKYTDIVQYDLIANFNSVILGDPEVCKN